jgi:hypothetical protein
MWEKGVDQIANEAAASGSLPELFGDERGNKSDLASEGTSAASRDGPVCLWQLRIADRK